MYDSLEIAIASGTANDIDREAAQYGLVRAISPDACEHCLAGIDAGHDHRECVTLVPATRPASARY